MEGDWRESALCKQIGVPVEVFYAEYGSEAEQEAKAICCGCLAVSQCLEDAMETRDYHGVQGGLTGIERHRLFNKIRKVRRNNNEQI